MSQDERRSFYRFAFAFIAVAACLWSLALASMIGGNPTAVNAVVGIPMGLCVFGAMAYVIARD
jgi:hypothetical protein